MPISSKRKKHKKKKKRKHALTVSPFRKIHIYNLQVFASYNNNNNYNNKVKQFSSKSNCIEK